MTTSPNTPTAPQMRAPLRLRLRDSTSTSRIDGAWWPQSRSLQTEAADLIDHFPEFAGRINRLLFSRPDWDDSVVDGRGARRVHAGRGPVKVGSFPSDDTHLMILAMSSERRIRLLVVPSDTEPVEAVRQMRAAGEPAASTSDADWARWDDEAPGS